MRERVLQRLPLQRAELDEPERVVGGAAGGDLPEVARELQPHQAVQRVDEVAGEPGVDPAGSRRAPRSRSAVPSAVDAVLERERADAVHQREDPELLQVDLRRLAPAQAGQAPPPAALAAELLDGGGEAGVEGVAPGQQPPEIAPARRRGGAASPATTAASRKIARFIGPSGSLPCVQSRSDGAEALERLAPERAAQHDAAGTGRIAEVDQRRGEGVRHRLEPGEGEAVAQDQRVVLVGADDLLAAALAAHHDEAAVGAQRLGGDERPEPLEDPAVEPADEAGDDLDPHAVVAEDADHALDLTRRRAELGHASPPARPRARSAASGWRRRPSGRAGSARRRSRSPSRTITRWKPWRSIRISASKSSSSAETDSGSKIATSRTGEPLGRDAEEQRVAQVGGGEDAEPVAVAHQRPGAAALGELRGRG